MLAIHLQYRHAILPDQILKNKKGIYGQEITNSLSEILKANVAAYMQAFPKELFQENFHKQVKNIIEKSMADNDESLVSTQYYTDISSMIAAINELKRKKQDITIAFSELAKEIDGLDTYVDSLISDNIELMALFSEKFRQLMGLSLPENGSMITLKGNMQALKARMKKDPEEVLPKLQKVVADTMGFIHEAEILRGGLKAYKEAEEKVSKATDIAFIQSGAIKKNNTQNADKLIEQLNNAEQALYSTISSISTSTPKADLIGYINGLTTGFSLKNASENKIKIKDKISWNRNKAITLGATGKALGSIMDEYKSIFGPYNKTYLAQIIYSFHGQEIRDPARRLRDVLDLAADLTIVDSLTGFKLRQNTAGTAQFFIVNNQAFAMSDIINAIIKSLETYNKTGVFTANDQLTNIISQGELRLKQALKEVKDIDEKHAIQIRLGEAWANTYQVKTKISLTALMSGNNILRSL